MPHKSDDDERKSAERGPYMELCDQQTCCGCGACVNICPKGSVSLRYGQTGVLYPQIDAQSCLNCGACASVCPQKAPVQLRTPVACYAAYRKDAQRRLDSASGGIGALLYETFFHNGGRVAAYGVTWNPDKERAEFSRVTTALEAEQFKGSMYVQPFTGELYRQIAADLKTGASVLFVGLPCHVSACKLYLNKTHVQTDGLYTVDLLCHGVSSHKYLTEELEYLKKKRGFTIIKNITFRSNRKGRNYHLSLRAQKRDGKPCGYCKSVGEDPYFRAFLDGVSLNESCYRCRFSCDARVGDMTIGDFIGLGEQAGFAPYEGVKKNASVVLVNSEKGSLLLKSISEQTELFQRTYAEAVQGGASLRSPFPRHVLRDAFLETYERQGFVKAMQGVAGRAIQKSRLQQTALRAISLLNLEPETVKKFAQKFRGH